MAPGDAANSSRSSAPFPAVLVLAAGAIFAISLQSLVRQPVFYSGDAGMKLLMARQFATGRAGFDLILPGPQWASEIRSRGFMPFGKPFILELDGRIVPNSPLTFPLISAPFLAVGGWRGLYVLPFISLLAIWWWGWHLGRRLRFTPLEQTICLAALVFGSHATVYSAMFWEHLPAAALAMWGIYPLLVAEYKPPSVRAALTGGVLAGLSAWLRPECICLAGLAIVVWAIPLRRQQRTRSWLAFAISAAAVIAVFMTLNLLLYGYPLGAHSLEVVRDRSLADRIGRDIPRIARELSGLLVIYCPLAVLAALLAIRMRFGKVADSPPSRLLGLMAWFGMLLLSATILISPSDGGFQWGPRYLIPLAVLFMPAVGLCLAALRAAGRRLERAIVLVLICLALAFSILENTAMAAADLRDNYALRVRPALEYLQMHGDSPVVSTDQFVAQELAWRMDKQPFFAIDPRTGEEDRLLELAGMFSKAGQTRFTFIRAFYGPRRPPLEPRVLTGDGVRVDLRPVGQIGLYYDIYDGVIRH